VDRLIKIDGLAFKIKTTINKYKYVLIVLIAGIILMVIPGRTESESTDTKESVSESVSETEKRLTELLSKGKGVGRVSVMITLEYSEKTVYMQNETRREGGSEIEEEKEISTVSEGNTEIPLVQETRGAQYRGACIICDGADNAQVRLWITDAVSDLLNIGSDKISIIQYGSKG